MSNQQRDVSPAAMADGQTDPKPTSFPQHPSASQPSETSTFTSASPSRWGSFFPPTMTNHHLSMEQRFHLEAAFREIDTCEDIEKLRELTKQIITAQENEGVCA